MKKAVVLASLLVISLLAAAQSHDFRFFPVKDLPLVYQGFVGKVGSHFFMLNRLSPNGLDIYVYDTVSQTGSKRLYPFPRQITSVLVFEKSVVFVGVSLNRERAVNYHYIELDENGDSIRHKVDTLTISNPLMNTLVSPNQKHILFYQYYKRGADSAMIQGSMIGSDGSAQKTLTYIFKHDKERDGEPDTFVDNNGNTHILVYDKYNNYRLSTDLTINSIPFTEDEMVSESFALQKIKLKTMNIFQDGNPSTIHAQGMYADGTIKSVRGMYSISFPLTRINELRQKFSAFTPEMIKEFKKGYTATDAGICNSLLLTEMLYTDSGSYAVFRINSESVQQQEKRIRGNRMMMAADPLSTSLVASRANTWNAPKLIYVKMSQAQDLAWHSIKSLDVFRFPEVKYNRVFLGGDKEEIISLMHQADKSEEPQPILLSIRDGKQTIEKLPEKFMTFSPIQRLSKQLFGSIYQSKTSGEGGILLIRQVAQ